MIEKVVKTENKNTITAITNICNRCRGEKLKRNYHNILYCEECFSYQIINEYMYLERRHRKKKSSNHSLNLNFKLSKSQLKGEKFILDCYKNKKTGFLHAVCGAGKTEMCLKTIYKALQNNQSICFVIPRVEIIKQLCKRFNIYFPKTKIIGLYQNQFFDETADIFVSTPQQLIRFYKEFDLLIIDEVDAFPFANNPFLKRLIKKAKKINTTTIYISATINNEFKELIKNKKIAYFLIANRFHNHDLIMPRLSKYKTVFSKITVDAIKKYLCNKQKLIVFFPSISLMKKYSLFLKKI
ncbi:MAG: DEAD/DEAH box helicase family protein [Bacillota bacterium]